MCFLRNPGGTSASCSRFIAAPDLLQHGSEALRLSEHVGRCSAPVASAEEPGDHPPPTLTIPQNLQGIPGSQVASARHLASLARMLGLHQTPLFIAVAAPHHKQKSHITPMVSEGVENPWGAGGSLGHVPFAASSPISPSPSSTDGHRAAGLHVDPICFLHPEQSRGGLQGFGAGPIPRPKGCVQWASGSIGVPSAGPISGLAGLSKPSTSPTSLMYILAASDDFPRCWSKASRPFARCNMHAFILHPEFSSRAPLEISPCFGDPNLPHKTGRGGWARPTGRPCTDLPVGSQVVPKNLLGLRRQSRGLKCLWVCADLHQQKTWHALSLVSRATEVTFSCYQHRGEGGRDYNPRSSGSSVELVTLCLGIEAIQAG